MCWQPGAGCSGTQVMQECKNAADRGTEQAVVTAVIVVVRSGEEARVQEAQFSLALRQASRFNLID
jgi:hypothetical protein